MEDGKGDGIGEEVVDSRGRATGERSVGYG